MLFVLSPCSCLSLAAAALLPGGCPRRLFSEPDASPYADNDAIAPDLLLWVCSPVKSATVSSIAAGAGYTGVHSTVQVAYAVGQSNQHRRHLLWLRRRHLSRCVLYHPSSSLPAQDRKYLFSLSIFPLRSPCARRSVAKFLSSNLSRSESVAPMLSVSGLYTR